MSEPDQRVEVLDEDNLYHRVARDHVDSDGAVNSAAFKQHGKPSGATPVHLTISANLARLTTLRETLGLAERPTFGVGSLEAKVPRSEGLSVTHSPEPTNPAHCDIEGQYTKMICRNLALATRLVVEPDESRDLAALSSIQEP